MQFSQRASSAITYGKLLGIPLLIVTFFHPVPGVWSAFWNVIMNPSSDMSTRVLIGVLYGAIFLVLAITAFKGLRIFGFVIFLTLIAVLTWFLVDQGLVGFNSKEAFGWFGIIIATLFGYVAVFGATIYRVLTGRVSTDSEDPDT